MAVIGSGSSGRGGAPGGGTIIIRGTWKLTQEKNGLGERTNRRTKKERKAKTSRGWGLADSGQGHFGWVRGRSPPGELHSPVGEGPDRSVTAAARLGALQRDPGWVGAAESLLAPGEGEKRREGAGGTGVLKASRDLSAALTSPPVRPAPEGRVSGSQTGVGRPPG